MNVKMTTGQANVVAYFAGFRKPYTTRTNQATYATCRERGWIEATDEFPFHQTTTAGLETLREHLRNAVAK